MESEIMIVKDGILGGVGMEGWILGFLVIQGYNLEVFVIQRWNLEGFVFKRGNFAKSYFFPSSFVSSSRRPVNLRRMKVMIQSISPRNMEAACNRGESNLPIGKSFPPEGRGGWRKLRFPQCRRPSSRKSACRPAWRRLCSTTPWRPWGPTWR